jgi:hypothetical protein
MKRWLVELAAQLLAIVALVVAVGMMALIFGGGVGGAAIGIAPELHFRLVGDLGLLCQSGETVTVVEGGEVTTTDSDGNTSTVQAIDIRCDSPNGESRMLTTEQSITGILASVRLALAGYFLS